MKFGRRWDDGGKRGGWNGQRSANTAIDPFPSFVALAHATGALPVHGTIVAASNFFLGHFIQSFRFRWSRWQRPRFTNFQRKHIVGFGQGRHRTTKQQHASSMRNGGLGGCRFNFQQRRVAAAGRGGGKAVLFVQIGIPGRKEKEKEKRRRRTIRKKEEIPTKKKEKAPGCCGRTLCL